MRREKARVTIMVCSIALAGMAFAANASAQCSRETLQKLADTYVQAQTTGKATMLPLAANASYAENDQTMDIAKGVLAGALKVDFTRSFHDTTQCATFTELVAATDPHPYVIHTRMEATKNGKKVSKMESVVTDAGDWVFGAPEHLAVTRTEKWDEIPKDKRDTRAAIQAAADAYLNNWGEPTLPVPHGTPCSRLEGRISTAAKDPAGQTCTMGAFPQKLNVSNRRYVIDEEYGSVSVFNGFPFIEASKPFEYPSPSSNQIRVEGGGIRYIHEVTICATKGCSQTAPPPPPAQ